MLRDEHLEAKTLEDDDKITNIIQNAKIIPVGQEEALGHAQMARLQTPQHVFGRLGTAITLLSLFGGAKVFSLFRGSLVGLVKTA